MGSKLLAFKNRFAFLTFIIILVFALAAGIIFSAGAVKAPQGTPDAVATMDDNNNLIFHIHGTVQLAGNVVVQYWSNDTGPFLTAPVASSGTSFNVDVMRLRPSTLYSYRVYLEDSSNKPVFQTQGSFLSGPLPAGLQGAIFDLIQGSPSYDLTLLDFNDSDFDGIVAIDQDAQVVWYYQHERQVFAIAQESDYNLVFNEIASGNGGWEMTEISPTGDKINFVEDTLNSGKICKPFGRWNHEMFLRPDGKAWTIGAEIRPVNLGGNITLQCGGTIEEWDIQNDTVKRLVSTFDLIDPVTDRRTDSNTTAGFFWEGNNNQYAPMVEDWDHANDLDVLPDGSILMSLRHLDQVIDIKPDFSGINWRLGGQGSDFTFPDPDDQFYHQHYVKMLPNGHIIMFDNGNLRPDSQGGQYSRALELELDFNTMQAKKVWEYRPSPDLFCNCCGSVQMFDNGNTVIDFAQDSVHNPPIINLVEVDAKGNVVSNIQISSPGKNIQYRAYPVSSIDGETKGQITGGQ
jgi:hypothetical protein